MVVVSSPNSTGEWLGPVDDAERKKGSEPESWLQSTQH